jgi:hypothetical protein
MTLTQLFEIRERLINEAIEFSKTLPESERKSYVNAYIDAAIDFYALSMIAYIDSEMEDKKSA